ncbi:hypothetical protein CBR_g56610 [Chara braunii]|uniref:Uncharacterized protein n=1 Tax=Chara braunii TaxID=69332 RepID=A0A388MDR9_CHABU|nr:hypothetical protein CBR_g56610 [Chara braunii]|eukprot:GBG92645.1 hypothetical protein CBR_g56610 [Chara braunii]
MLSVPSTSMTMSPETHMRLAEPFPPCARSVRRYNGHTCIDGATAKDFEEDPWMTVVPYTDRHLDDWSDATWKAMESGCPWASHYKFANMLEFGDLITLPDGVLERKFLNHVRKTVHCISRHCSRLDCEYITSSPRTWGSSRKQELLDCARHCSFLEQYPLRRPGICPQVVSYCGVQLTIAGCDFARVLCVSTSNKSRKLVDAIVYVSRNEVAIVAEGGRPTYRFSPLRLHSADGWSDLIIAGQVDDFSLWHEMEEKVSDIRHCIGKSLAQPGGFVRMKYMSVLSENATVEGPQIHVYGSSMNAMYGFGSRRRPRETPYDTPRPSTSAWGEEEGVQQPAHKRRGGPQEEGTGSAKKHKARTPQTTGGKRKGVEGQEGTSGRKRPASVQKQPQPGALEAKGPIDVDAPYFLEWKDGVRTKREFFISPSQVVDIDDWEPSYNQRSLDPVHTQIIIDAMMTAFSQTEKTYELPTLKLAPLGLEKPKSGVRADRLKPEDWKDELADQYYYYAVSGQHNAAAAKALLGTDIALRYNFGRWPARTVYFSDEEFNGYFLVSSEDNMKDLKAPPRQLKLSMKNIRWLWREKGFPKAVMGSPSRKQAQLKTWREFCSQALHKTPYNHLWLLGDEKGEDSIKKQNAALRSYFPLVMAGKSAWELGMEFFEKWETGRLLAPEGARWITRKRKVQGVRPGVSHIENDKLGRKEVVYNVPVDAPQKKGKKEKESGDWFVQVTEPDPHCWKSMEALTDNEKCWLLKKVLNCEVVWVQTGSASLAKQGKEAVHLLKCDRILVRLWNYYQFVHENRSAADWTRAYPFLKKRESILAEFEKQGMDASLWEGSRKLVGDASLFKGCPPYMGCEDDKTTKATEKLAQNKKLSADWKNKVLSMLTGSRAKSMEVALVEGVVHVLWKDSGEVTSIAPFGVDPLEARLRVTELEKAVGTTLTLTQTHS